MPGEAVTCTAKARGPIMPESGPESAAPAESRIPSEEVKMQQARVGQKAPDFEAMGYIDGGFKRYMLSDYAGEWVMVCFYPGDFTFV
jgi:hypothetical protein